MFWIRILMSDVFLASLNREMLLQTWTNPTDEPKKQQPESSRAELQSVNDDGGKDADGVDLKICLKLALEALELKMGDLPP